MPKIQAKVSGSLHKANFYDQSEEFFYRLKSLSDFSCCLLFCCFFFFLLKCFAVVCLFTDCYRFKVVFFSTVSLHPSVKQ